MTALFILILFPLIGYLLAGTLGLIIANLLLIGFFLYIGKPESYKGLAESLNDVIVYIHVDGARAATFFLLFFAVATGTLALLISGIQWACGIPLYIAFTVSWVTLITLIGMMFYVAKETA